ncbi:MAG: insulinase family protein [Bacteroidales bacterium]|nr:insulinase family protein [Bacteroidales bacterium]
MSGEKIVFACKKVASPVAYCALSIKTGTRYEPARYNGLAHLVEHMLFKGTAKRTSNSINNVLEREGGELNAYTTKEEIVLCATVLREDLPKAVDLLAELAFTSVFPQKELDKELDVVYDEIISYKDSPAESIYDHFETLLFKGHPLEKAILGEKRTLRKIDSTILKEFLTANFTPDKMVFTAVGNVEEATFQKLVQKSVNKYYKSNIEALPNRELDSDPDYEKENSRVEACGCSSLTIGTPFALEVTKRNHQAHCIIGSSAYSYSDGSRRIALALITNILGGPASISHLNNILREKHALVYNIEANFTPYSDTGIFSIYFGCDKSLLGKCKELVYKELERIVNVPLTERELKNAKKQFLGQLFISQDNAESQCLAMGKSIMVYGKMYPFEQTRKQIEQLTAAQLQQVAQEVLSKDRLSELVYK